MNAESTDERKQRHLRAMAEDPGTDRGRHYFDALRLTHRALPELDLSEVDLSIDWLGRRLSMPLLISSMTGGVGASMRALNRNLAEAAEAEGVAFALGSQRVMIEYPEARSSFQVRDVAPNVFLFANLGAVQLNAGFTVDQALEAVDTARADALYVHLNPLQEAVQRGGDTNFKGLAERIGRVVRALGKPVAVKEVGAGLSRPDAERLLAEGVDLLDVAGAGGTSWSRIEYAGDRGGPGLLFQDWGIPTPKALIDLWPLRHRARIVASGGLRNGIDMAKALMLGASLCGMAAPFLPAARQSTEAVRQVIARLRRELATALFLLGVGSVRALPGRFDLMADWGPWAPPNDDEAGPGAPRP